MEPVRDGRAMVAGMRPELRPGRWVFAASEEPGLVAQALGSFREAEGMSLILPVGVAEEAGLPVDQPMRQITLGVFSALDGVGLTAAVAGALAERGIACNVVAALRHDHAFVPEARAEEALEVLRALSAGAG
jgi:hypothetical protein